MTKGQSFSSSLQVCYPQPCILVTKKKDTKQGVKTSEGRTNPKQRERQEKFDCHLIRTASQSTASKGKTFHFGPCALDGEYNRSKLKKRLICSAVALIITLLRLIQELETSEITTRSDIEH